MKYYVGVTDNEWFNFLRERKPDEVNFWRPSSQAFRALNIGEPFLFKLHLPQNFIAGGGFFFQYTKLPLSMAWKVFEEKNGAPNYSIFSNRISPYFSSSRKQLSDPEIGCIILVTPFFFEREDWIPAPKNFTLNIPGRSYDSGDSIGGEVWSKVELNLQKNRIGTQPLKLGQVADPSPRYGSKHLVETRLGQGAFRVNIMDTYGRRCSVSGEKTLPVLEAAHIKPYTESGPHSTHNGLLLRADLHILLDEGYMTVTKDYKVEVSRRIKEDYENGRDYYKFHGQQLMILPKNVTEFPAPEFLEWHQVNRYRG
jgi:putative restriction endonuclease